jgi:hypothetical protein
MPLPARKNIWAYMRENTTPPKIVFEPLYSLDNTCYLRAYSIFVLGNSGSNTNEQNPSKFPFIKFHQSMLCPITTYNIPCIYKIIFINKTRRFYR